MSKLVDLNFDFNDSAKVEDLFMHFKAKCGHEWIAPHWGTWMCPLCGFYEGDGGLLEQDFISVDRVPIGLLYQSIAAWYELYSNMEEQSV